MHSTAPTSSRSRRSVALGLVGAAAMTLAVTACGGSSDGGDKAASKPTPTETPSASATTEPAETGSGACRYVTTEQASDLAASPVKSGVNRKIPTGPVTFEFCDYIFDPGNAPGVSVAVADLKGQGAQLFAAFRQEKSTESEYQVVPGVGDEAFFSGQNLTVRKGDKGLILFVGRANGSPRGEDAIPDEKRLAALVLDTL